jgi:hypothetical protein
MTTITIRRLPLALAGAALLLLAAPGARATADGASAGAGAGAEGPGTPQAVAAHAEFLATLPPPPGGAGAVCVIDSGVDTTTDLGPALTRRTAYDGGTPDDTGARGDDGTPLPKHGTYVAGVIASQIDGIGTNGIWPAAKVLSRRVFGGPSSATTAADYVTAIDWCLADLVRDNVKVINLSLSGLNATLSDRQRLDDKITQVRLAPYNVNVVAAAGNNGLGYVGYPADATDAFSVGATDASGMLTPFSNRGAGLDISTFGASTCLTTSRGSRLGQGSGTSFAAPVVSAVLDALRSYRTDLSPADAESLLISTADVIGPWRTLNAAAAFRAASIPVSIDPQQAPRVCVGSPAAAASAPGSTATPPVDDFPDIPSAAPAPVLAGVGAVTPPIVAQPSVAAAPRRGAHRPGVRVDVRRRGRIIIRVSGRRSSDVAIVRVRRRERTRRGVTIRDRTYRRAADVFRISAPHWLTITVRFAVDGIFLPGVATAHSDRDLL